MKPLLLAVVLVMGCADKPHYVSVEITDEYGQGFRSGFRAGLKFQAEYGDCRNPAILEDRKP